jgi:hypothetical protein
MSDVTFGQPFRFERGCRMFDVRHVMRDGVAIGEIAKPQKLNHYYDPIEVRFYKPNPTEHLEARQVAARFFYNEHNEADEMRRAEWFVRCCHRDF